MNRTKIIRFVIYALLISLILVTTTLIWIQSETKNSIFSDIDLVPQNKVGIVPGCNKYIARGVLNQYYVQRIDAAEYLFKNGKIEYILVSGDNAQLNYNEPTQMKKSLIEKGIPEEKIFLDYAGFRTLDTIIRAKEVFQLEAFTFISQDFHNQRGVFIGNKKNIDVVGYNANYNKGKDSLKIEVREIMAKIKMISDLYITNEKPKFLGEKIVIGEEVTYE